MVELVKSGRRPTELAREHEPSAGSIRNWVAQSERDAGQRSDGLSTDELLELRDRHLPGGGRWLDPELIGRIGSEKNSRFSFPLPILELSGGRRAAPRKGGEA